MRQDGVIPTTERAGRPGFQFCHRAQAARLNDLWKQCRRPGAGEPSMTLYSVTVIRGPSRTIKSDGVTLFVKVRLGFATRWPLGSHSHQISIHIDEAPTLRERALHPLRSPGHVRGLRLLHWPTERPPLHDMLEWAPCLGLPIAGHQPGPRCSGVMGLPIKDRSGWVCSSMSL